MTLVDAVKEIIEYGGIVLGALDDAAEHKNNGPETGMIANIFEEKLTKLRETFVELENEQC